MTAGRSRILFSWGRKGPREGASWVLKKDKNSPLGWKFRNWRPDTDCTVCWFTILSLVADKEAFFLLKKENSFFYFFTMCHMWGLSSLTRDQICATCSGRVASQPAGHQGSPWRGFFGDKHRQLHPSTTTHGRRELRQVSSTLICSCARPKWVINPTYHTGVRIKIRPE